MGRILSLVVEMLIVAMVFWIVLLSPRAVKRAAGMSSADERLCSAAWVGDGAALNEALEDGANVNGRDPRGGTPLCYAAMGGQRRSAERLLALGANVDVADDFGATPLMRAAAGDHAEIVSLLLKQGADSSARSRRDGFTALDFA